jgi:hypothetical protein
MSPVPTANFIQRPRVQRPTYVGQQQQTINQELVVNSSQMPAVRFARPVSPQNYQNVVQQYPPPPPPSAMQQQQLQQQPIQQQQHTTFSTNTWNSRTVQQQQQNIYPNGYNTFQHPGRLPPSLRPVPPPRISTLSKPSSASKQVPQTVPEYRKVLPPFPVGHTFIRGSTPPNVLLKVGVSNNEREGPDGASSSSPPSSNDDANISPNCQLTHQQTTK